MSTQQPKTKKYTELDEEDFWNENRYYLTDGIDFMTKKEFLNLKKRGKTVYVVSNKDNTIDLAFEIE